MDVWLKTKLPQAQHVLQDAHNDLCDEENRKKTYEIGQMTMGDELSASSSCSCQEGQVQGTRQYRQQR